MNPSTKWPEQWSPLAAWIFVAVMFVGLVGAVVTTTFPPVARYEWNIDSINAIMPVPALQDAENIVIMGHPGSGGYLALSFSAPPQKLNAFMREVCSSGLFAGYDPFQAVDLETNDPVPNSMPINMGLRSYYSYSPNVPTTILGNRCFSPPRWHQFQVRIDTSDAKMYKVRLDVRFTCTVCK